MTEVASQCQYIDASDATPGQANGIGKIGLIRAIVDDKYVQWMVEARDAAIERVNYQCESFPVIVDRNENSQRTIGLSIGWSIHIK